LISISISIANKPKQVNHQQVSTFLTAGNVKLMLLHTGKSEDAIRNFFQDVYELYVKVRLFYFLLSFAFVVVFVFVGFALFSSVSLFVGIVINERNEEMGWQPRRVERWPAFRRRVFVFSLSHSRLVFFFAFLLLPLRFCRADIPREHRII